MLVYLAGPIKGLTYDGSTVWRDYATRHIKGMGHTPFSPMRGKEYLKSYGELNGGDSKDGSYGEFPMSSAQGLFRRDTFDVGRCDVTLANLAGAAAVSIGTCMEIQRAYDCGKYVITVIDADTNPHNHAFIKQASSVVVKSLDEALLILGVLGSTGDE